MDILHLILEFMGALYNYQYLNILHIDSNTLILTPNDNYAAAANHLLSTIFESFLFFFIGAVTSKNIANNSPTTTFQIISKNPFLYPTSKNFKIIVATYFIFFVIIIYLWNRYGPRLALYTSLICVFSIIEPYIYNYLINNTKYIPHYALKFTTSILPTLLLITMQSGELDAEADMWYKNPRFLISIKENEGNLEIQANSYRSFEKNILVINNRKHMIINLEKVTSIKTL